MPRLKRRCRVSGHFMPSYFTYLGIIFEKCKFSGRPLDHNLQTSVRSMQQQAARLDSTDTIHTYLFMRKKIDTYQHAGSACSFRDSVRFASRKHLNFFSSIPEMQIWHVRHIHKLQITNSTPSSLTRIPNYCSQVAKPSNTN